MPFEKLPARFVAPIPEIEQPHVFFHSWSDIFDAVEFGKELQVPHRGEPFVQARNFGGDSDGAPDTFISLAHLETRDLRLARAWLDEAREHSRAGCLACAVRPKQTKDLSRAHVERQAIDCQLSIK